MKILNPEKTNRKGRPPKDQISKFRTLLWYWAVIHESELSDGKLDIEFSTPEADGTKRAYTDRIRIFEAIRKSGCTISSGKHTYRNFNLIARVNNHPRLKGSAAVYESILWDILSEKHPTLKQTTLNFVRLIKICNLSKFKLNIYQPPNEDELLQLSKILNVSSDKINKILTPEIITEERKIYDDILQSFSNVSHYFGILEKAEFDNLAYYLNILAFYITFYRYTLLKGNYHALIAAADAINEHLSLLLNDIKWLKKPFSKALFQTLYRRVFQNDTNNSQNQEESKLLLDEISAADESSALHNLSILFSN